MINYQSPIFAFIISVALTALVVIASTLNDISNSLRKIANNIKVEKK